MRIGKITVGSLNEWTLTPGTVTSWHPTAAAAEKARQAPVSSVPVSYMQGQHLRNYCERTAAGLNFSRQIIASCDEPASAISPPWMTPSTPTCVAMTHSAAGSSAPMTASSSGIRSRIRLTSSSSRSTRHLTVDKIRAHTIAIPNPLEWGCFTFGVVQRESQFTFFVAMDHVHGDATLIGTTMI